MICTVFSTAIVCIAIDDNIRNYFPEKKGKFIQLKRERK